MENLVSPAFWQDKRVLLTGHTGFKGSWLALWLQKLGAEVTGYALTPHTEISLFQVAKVGDGMRSIIGDIRDFSNLQSVFADSQPEIVLHLAAQALVADGYQDPLGTYATNVQGTANLLETIRHSHSVRAVVIVTSDKCYDNKEWPWPYRENEALGGYDPYSSSKACTELVTACYRQSFLAEAGIHLATARAGNVFGGGDWSAHRLIPDLLAAFSSGNTARLRRPNSIRPWQHVLEPLSAYLMLAERLYDSPDFAKAWNIGPSENDCLSAGEIADRLAKIWGESAHWQAASGQFPHEAGLLRLDTSLAHKLLGWHPRWSLDQGLAATVSWQHAWLTASNMRNLTLQQIEEFNAHVPGL